MNATMSSLPETTSHLRKLRGGLLIPATTGKRTFVTEQAKFTGSFGTHFAYYGTNVPSAAMQNSPSVVYEVTHMGHFKTILESFKISFRDLFWKSQDQILAFISKYPEYFRIDDESEVSFPLNMEDSFFCYYC